MYFIFVDRQNNPPDRNPGPKNGAENCNEFVEFWNLLFDVEIRTKIVECTNKQIEDVCADLMAQNVVMQTYHHTTDLQEINAFIGLLYYAAQWKSNRVDVKELWSATNGISLYRCVMPKSRFMFLGNCLRFDTRETRSDADRLSPVREIWDHFIKNCNFYYQPSNEITVDEQLLSFRGRCKFRMYIKSKPDKYGLKIITMNDAQTFYMVIYFIFLSLYFFSNNNFLYCTFNRFMVFHIWEKLAMTAKNHLVNIS